MGVSSACVHRTPGTRPLLRAGSTWACWGCRASENPVAQSVARTRVSFSRAWVVRARVSWHQAAAPYAWQTARATCTRWWNSLRARTWSTEHHSENKVIASPARIGPARRQWRQMEEGHRQCCTRRSHADRTQSSAGPPVSSTPQSEYLRPRAWTRRPRAQFGRDRRTRTCNGRRGCTPLALLSACVPALPLRLRAPAFRLSAHSPTACRSCRELRGAARAKVEEG